MRAQVWLGGAGFTVADATVPELGAGEVLVELEVATVCGSDRHTVSGRRPGACPSVLGHEGVGVVAESRRAGIEPGQRVVFSVTSVCHECVMCRRGLSAKCERVQKVGHESFDGSWPWSGTYATHIHLPAGVEVVEVPPELSSERASTAGCAVATVMAMVEAAGDLRDKSVLVTGLGMLGITAVAAARAGGARRIIACDPAPGAREAVRGLADEVVDVASGELVDVSFELSGSSAGTQACLDALAVGGVAVLAGAVAPGPGVTLDPEWVVRGWRTVTGVHNYEPRHLGQAVSFLDRHGDSLPWDHIFGRRVSLAELPEVFAEPVGARVLVDCRS